MKGGFARRAGGVRTLQSFVFFGRVGESHPAYFFFFSWLDFTFVRKNLSCVFGFPLCGQHKGLWDGMWGKGVCSLPKCMF